MQELIGQTLMAVVVRLELSNVPYQVIRMNETQVQPAIDYIPGRLLLEVDGKIVTDVHIQR